MQENESVTAEPEKHSLLILPNPSVVAGDRFREIYYWDSYFIVEGLLVSGMIETAKVRHFVPKPLPVKVDSSVKSPWTWVDAVYPRYCLFQWCHMVC